jgi:hypothetical protein
MSDEILVFDAAGSNIDGTDPGSPLSIGPGTSYPITECAYPAPPLNVQYASSIDTEGELPVSQRYGNRTITIKVEMVDAAGTLRAALQGKFAKLQREGGTLKRTMKNADVRIYDIVAADGWSPIYDFAYYLGDLTVVEMTLPARPFSRGVEADLGDNTTTTLPWLVFTEATVDGDVPALGRLVIDNDEATAMRHVIWGIQQRNYSAASTAALYYEAESCAMANSSTAVGPAGASGGGSNVARYTALTATPTGLIYLGASSTAQTHIGTFRVFARVYCPNTNTGTVSVGAVWTPSPQGASISNPTVAVTDSAATPLENQWIVVDLGLVTLPKAKKGTQGWIGYVAASSTVVGDDIDVDWVALVPGEESYGEAYTINPLSFALAAAGTYWVAPPVFQGDYLLIPPSGAEARTLRVICRFSSHVPLNADRATTSTNADVVGDVSAKLFVTPRYLT